MTAAEVATIGAVVTTLTQIIKQTPLGAREGWGIYIAGVVSLLCVLAWVASATYWPPARTDLWALFSGWVTVFATAAGIHSISTHVTRVRKVKDAEPLP